MLPGVKSNKRRCRTFALDPKPSAAVSFGAGIGTGAEIPRDRRWFLQGPRDGRVSFGSCSRKPKPVFQPSSIHGLMDSSSSFLFSLSFRLLTRRPIAHPDVREPELPFRRWEPKSSSSLKQVAGYLTSCSAIRIGNMPRPVFRRVQSGGAPIVAPSAPAARLGLLGSRRKSRAAVSRYSGLANIVCRSKPEKSRQSARLTKRLPAPRYSE